MMRWLVPLGCVALLLACDDDGGDDDPNPTADSAVDTDGGGLDLAPDPEPDAAPMPGASMAPEAFRVPMIPAGQTVERAVRMTNIGNVAFEITGLAIDPQPGFQLLYRLGERRSIIVISFAGQDVGNFPQLIEPGATVDIIVQHRPTEDGTMPSGTVTVETTLPAGVIELPIEAVDAVGEIAADPEAVVFGRVPPGDTAEQIVEISNPGAAPLTVQAIALQGDIDFSVTADGAPVDDILADPDGDGSPGLAPGGLFALTVTYAPVAEGLDEGVLSIVNDDLTRPDLRIPLSGNDTTGCILVDPSEMFTVQFDEGEVERVEVINVSNCGGQPLTVDNIRFRPGTPPEAFAFPEDSLPEFPTTLDPGADAIAVQITMTLAADRVYSGALQIASNDPEQPDIVVEFDAVPFGGGMEQP